MTLLAGVAKIEITPPYGVQLSGYPHVRRLSTGTHDPLMAAALVLNRDGVIQVQVALDLLFLDPPTAREIRRRAAAAAGTDEKHVFVGCTHTHSGPVTAPIFGWAGDVAAPAPDPAYLELVKDRVVKNVGVAASRQRPAMTAWTTARVSGVGCNRHSPDGVTDPEAGILAVRDAATGDMIAVVTIYGMHPTVLHEDSTLVSADFPFFARCVLRERFGAGMVVLYFNGPCGNQSPRYHVRRQTFAEAERLGRHLGLFIADAIAALDEKAFSADRTLGGILRSFQPVRRALPSLAAAEQTLTDYRNDYARLQEAGAARAVVRTAECAVFGAEGAVNLARAAASGAIDRMLADYAPFEVQGLRVGDSCLIGLPGELFTEYGLEIKKTEPGRVFVVAFANGDLQGYITTPAAAAAGGYEAAGAVFDCQTGAVMVNAAAAAIRDLGMPSGQESHP